jgi:hypothetical protein
VGEREGFGPAGGGGGAEEVAVAVRVGIRVMRRGAFGSMQVGPLRSMAHVDEARVLMLRC